MLTTDMKGAPVRQHDLPTPRTRGRRLLAGAGLGSLALVLSGCDYKLEDGFLIHGITDGSQRVTALWNGAWIALIGVGLLVLGLMFWALVAFRRKKDDNELPPQIRYNVPIEILYTVVPLMMIIVFFYFTARDEAELVAWEGKKADVVVNVVGKQWSWDFNYVNEDVHVAGTQAIMTGEPGAEKTIPTLYLPVNERTRFVLTARDVIHSFWVPAFQTKLDMIPGRVNVFDVTPRELGHYKGKCTELCGAYHSNMLFNVEIVTRAEYDKQMQLLKDKGMTGQLDNGLNRQKLMPGQEEILKKAGM